MSSIGATLFIWISLVSTCTVDPPAAGTPVFCRPALRGEIDWEAEPPGGLSLQSSSGVRTGLIGAPLIPPAATALRLRGVPCAFPSDRSYRPLDLRSEIAEPAVPGTSSRLLLMAGILWAGVRRMAALCCRPDSRKSQMSDVPAGRQAV